MDIRDPAIHERKVKLIHPRFIYHKCCVCKFEFRRTTMWSFIADWGCEGEPYRAYACLSCVPEYKDVFKVIPDFRPTSKNKKKENKSIVL